MIKLESLTSITSKQLEQLSDITNDIEVMKWIGNGQTWSVAKIKKNIEYLKTLPNQFMAWVITETNNNVVGYLAITKDHNERDIRIFIGRQYQGKGYATNALRLLIKRLSHHKHIGVHLVSYVKPDNIASNKIHEKAGFKFKSKISKYGNIYNKYSYVIKSTTKSATESKNKLKSKSKYKSKATKSKKNVSITKSS